MILLHFGEFGGLLYGIVEAAKFIHEFDLLRIRGEPYTTLSDGIHLSGLHATTLRHDVEELLITLVDIGLQMLHDLIVVLTQDQVCLVVRELIGSHTVEGDTEFVGYESAEVGDESEDTDTTSDSGRLCEDVVGRRTDPVTARGSHTTHRYHYRLLGLQQFDGMTDLLRGNGTTAA